jgi:hypothetical protein
MLRLELIPSTPTIGSLLLYSYIPTGVLASRQPETPPSRLKQIVTLVSMVLWSFIHNNFGRSKTLTFI